MVGSRGKKRERRGREKGELKERESERGGGTRRKLKTSLSLLLPHPAVCRRPVVLQDHLRGHVDRGARPRRQRRIGGGVADRQAKVGRPHGRGRGRRGKSLVALLVGVEEEEIVRLGCFGRRGGDGGEEEREGKDMGVGLFFFFALSRARTRRREQEEEMSKGEKNLQKKRSFVFSP